MKVTYKNGLPVVPKEWRKLRENEFIRKGDRWVYRDYEEDDTWGKTGVTHGMSVPPTWIVIRRKKGTK